MAKVRHPNLIGIHVLDKTPAGQPYMVSDLIEGEPLTELVRQERPGPERIETLVSGICLGLEALHAAGILHRDLKPDNVLVRPDGTPVLLDFGIARELDAETLTQTGALMGTPGFMSPEQAQGHSFRELDARTDVYGVGAILYYLLARRAPHEGISVTQVLLATVERPIDWTPTRGAPSRLIEVARRALSKDPARRQASAAALREELSDTGNSRDRKRALLVGTSLVAAALSVLALAGVLLRGYEPGPSASRPPGEAATPSPSQTPDPALAQVFQPLHRPTHASPGSARIQFASNGLFLQRCQHSGKLRLIQHEAEGNTWRDLKPIRIPRGASLAYPQGKDHDRPPPWAIAWERVGTEFIGVDLRTRVAKTKRVALTDLNGLVEFPPERLASELGQDAILAQHVRSSDSDLLLAFASSPPARGPIRVFQFDWEQRQVARYYPARALEDAPANVRDLTSLQTGICVAAGQCAGGPPIRIWFIDPDQTVHGTWPYRDFPVDLPDADGTAVVGLALPERYRFVLWGDSAGGLHLVRWKNPTSVDPVEGAPARLRKHLELDRLPGPVLGLATVFRRGKLLLFAASGQAHDPEAWAQREANELRVYSLSLQPKTRLELLARRPLRPLAYAWLRVSHDGEWLWAARADCSIEIWSVAKLLASD